VPSGWAMAFWVPLIYAGAHAIGQRERHWVATEVISFTVALYRLLKMTWHLVYSCSCWSVVGWDCQRESRLCNQECCQRSCWPKLEILAAEKRIVSFVRTSAQTSLQTSIVRRLPFLCVRHISKKTLSCTNSRRGFSRNSDMLKCELLRYSPLLPS
jgi:hypothetical protein